MYEGDFGDILRQVRKERNMTLDEMANYLGTTKQALSRYERGERTPKITVAVKFANLLNISLEDLIGYEYHEGDPTFEDAMDTEVLKKFTADDYHLLEDMYEDKDLKLLIANIRMMDKTDRTLMIQMAKRLLGDRFIV